MIKVFNSASRESIQNPKMIPLNEVNVVTQNICMYTGRPQILFEHKDYPLGALVAEYRNDEWECDLC
jgi:hypothetical protein